MYLAGKIATDTMVATSAEEAEATLRRRGLFVTEIVEEPKVSGGAKLSGGRRVKNLALWSRQLSMLVRSGTPLAQAMGAVERQCTEGPWRTVLRELREKVEEGKSLSDAMSARAELFDDVTRSLVAAGESSGKLGDMLDRLARLIRQQLQTRRAIVGAMVYPALLIVVGLGVTLVMLLGVIPRFAGLFESLNASLPPTTEFLVVVSNAFHTYWWILLGVIVITGVGLKIYLSGSHGRRMIDLWATRIPYAGIVVRGFATARIARLLGVMLESRVPLLEALKLTQYATGNGLYADLIGKSLEAATRGEQISSVFSKSALIIPSVSEAMRHGEQNGQVGPILVDMADFLDEENQAILKTAMTMLEPLILIVLGVVVGFIALSLFIPLFDLTAQAGAS